MRLLLLFILLGLAALGLVTGTPSLAQARPWRGGWYGGWHRGFYPRLWWWGRPYAYPRWGWGAYYAYPAYYYPYYYPYPAYAYPSYPYSYPFDAVSAPPVSGIATSLYSSPSSGSAAPSPEETAESKVLTASGVANDHGRLHWPLGLQILGGPESGHQADELRGQLSALFQQAAEQVAKGPADAKLLQEITRAVERLRNLLTRDRQERGRLPRAVYDEAQRFLNQLEDAEAVLRAGFKTSGAQSH
jgi:hypothetical protein